MLNLSDIIKLTIFSSIYACGNPFSVINYMKPSLRELLERGGLLICLQRESIKTVFGAKI
jgi:hypothetical protein